MSEGQARRIEPIAVSAESTVVAEFIPEPTSASAYQSEAELEAEFIKILQSQAYDYLPIRTEADLIANLRTQLEVLNGITFSDAEWERYLSLGKRAFDLKVYPVLPPLGQKSDLTAARKLDATPWNFDPASVKVKQ